MATANKREKAHRLLKNSDPIINPLRYDTDLLLALQYFNINYDNKQKKKWVQARYPKAKFHAGHSDYYYKTLGTLVRLEDNGNTLSDKHTKVMQREFDYLTNEPKSANDDSVATVDESLKVEKKVLSIQEKMDNSVSAFMAEFNNLVDEWTMDRKVLPKVDKLVTQMGLKGPMLAKTIARIKPQMQEIADAIEGKDKQLVEGYSNFSKAELKKLHGIYEQLVGAVAQAKVSAPRKARVAKVKPAAVVAKSVKYCAENIDLKLKSINPALVVGTNEVWLFNSKYRKLFCYKAIQGQSLTFKGSTLLNWDTEKSESKGLRKPEVLHGLMDLGTRAWNKLMKETKSKASPCNGRINKETLILVAFK